MWPVFDLSGARLEYSDAKGGISPWKLDVYCSVFIRLAASMSGGVVRFVGRGVGASEGV